MTNFQVMQANIPEGMINFAQLGQGDSSFLAYGAMQGDGYLRRALAQFLSQGYGLPVEPAQLFITTGASQGLDLICTLFTQAGDTVFVEEPSYFLALRIFADHRLKPVGIPTDENGIIIEALEEKLARQQPVFLYTIPTFHNPSAVTLSAERRARLVELSQKYNFFIVADEVYHLLAYTATPPPPLAGHIEGGSVLSLGSFSKILAPGLRLGWIQAGQPWLEKFVGSGLLDSGGGLNPFTSAMVRSALELGLQAEHLELLKKTYRERIEVMSTALQTHLPALASFVKPDGGFFIWLRLPEGVDTAALLSEARQQQVGFEPGVSFSSRDGLRNYARLCFAYYNSAQIAEGIERLAGVIKRAQVKD